MSIYDKVGSTYDSMRSNVGVKDILHDVKALGDSIKVLDLGCGTGHPIAKSISPIVNKYCGIDNSQPMLDAYLKNVQNADCKLLEMSNINQIPGKWDLIFSWGAICHLPIELQKKTMIAAANLLKPEGRFLFTSGQETDECTGKVGKYTVYHYSMGRSAYTGFLKEQNMELIDSGFSEGDFYVYRFRKNT
jgi:cyclopropane fatty-acyl-phospholipid synthase-like methyltransferase